MADGGRVGLRFGKLAGKAFGLSKKLANINKSVDEGTEMGYGALREYGIEAEDITRLFKEIAMDRTMVGPEKTEYFKMLNQVLKNPDQFPDGIIEIKKRLGMDFADGGKVPAADSQLVKESEGIMGYRGKKGYFPDVLQHGYFSEKRYPRTLEETEKLDTVKDIFDEDQPITQDVIDLSEGFTLSPITYLKRLIAEMEIKNTRKTKKADGGKVDFKSGGLAKILEV